MANQLRKLSIIVALTVVLLLGVLLLANSYTVIGLTSEVGIAAFDLSTYDVSEVPHWVVEDATALAVELFGDYHGEYDTFVKQLLATYIEAQGKDCVLVFLCLDSNCNVYHLAFPFSVKLLNFYM